MITDAFVPRIVPRIYWAYDVFTQPPTHSKYSPVVHGFRDIQLSSGILTIITPQIRPSAFKVR